MIILAFVGLALPWVAGRVLSGADVTTVAWWAQNSLMVSGFVMVYMLLVGMAFSRAWQGRGLGLAVGLVTMMLGAAGLWIEEWALRQHYVILALPLAKRLVESVAATIQGEVVATVGFGLMVLAFIAGFSLGRMGIRQQYAGEYRLP